MTQELGAEVAAEKAVATPDETPQENPSEWRRVSPKFITVEIIAGLITTAVFLAFTTPLWIWVQWLAWPVTAFIVLFLIVSLIVMRRRVRSIGFQLREDDLVFKRGIMFHRQVAVPYGRMQLVDINRGPLMRGFGLCELKFVTAAAASAVTIPGLPIDEAEQLRDELVALAETRRAGL